MTGQLLVIIIFAAVVLLQYMSKRSFGFPVIGLIIGSIIANLWAEPVSMWLVGAIGNHEVNLIKVITEVSLLVIPATSIMWAGKAIRSKPLRIVGSLVFAVLLALLAFESAASLVELPASIVGLYDQARPFVPTAIGLAAVLAIFDVMAHSSTGKPKRTR